MRWFDIRVPAYSRPARIKLAIVAGVSAALSASLVIAATGHFTADRLSGANEVPARVTNASGIAMFSLRNDRESLDYHVNVEGITNVVQAHIHLGRAGSNGPIVVWLYPTTSPPAAPPGGGASHGLLSRGTITKANFMDELAGKEMQVLVDEIKAGNAYVNVHTNDGVPPTNTGPGDFPGGELRGQLRVQGHLHQAP
jgi:hypothetical protein